MATRKKSNLRASQDEHERRRIDLIRDVLVKFHANKVRFGDVTSLAKQVASVVMLKEKAAGEPDVVMSYTTLLRSRTDGSPNPYRTLLDAFMGGIFDPQNPDRNLTKKEIDAFINRNPALRAYVAEKDLTISNLKANIEVQTKVNEQFKAYFQTHDVPQLPEVASKLHAEELRQAKDDLAKTCTWIKRFLETQQGWIKIDEKNGIIVNLAEQGKPVASKDMLAPFFKVIGLPTVSGELA